MIATAAGSVPGRDFRGAMSAMLDAFDTLVPFPELPKRGPTSSMVGRAVGLIDALGFELGETAWQTSPIRTKRQRRARQQMLDDLEIAQELIQDRRVDLKMGMCGPATLLAALNRPRHEGVLVDRGARTEITLAHAQACQEFQAKYPMTLQLDEPSVGLVLDGHIRSVSKLHRYPPIENEEVIGWWKRYAPSTIVHSCGRANIWPLAKAASLKAVYVDPTYLSGDAIAEALSEGATVVLGIGQTHNPNDLPSVNDLVNTTRNTLFPICDDPTVLDSQVILAPACGLASWSQPDASAYIDRIKACAQTLSDR